MTTTRKWWPVGRQHLISTKARGDTCPRCRRIVIIGIAEGLDATVDTSTLTRPDELAALLTGRRTYTLVAGELVYRSDYRIRGQLPGPILAEHTCDPPTPESQQPATLFEIEAP